MYERLLYQILTEEFAELTAQPDRMLAFFRGFPFCLTQDEALRTRDAFLAKPPTVINSYPRHGSIQFPLIAITLEHEQETQQFLGAYGGKLTSEEITELGLPGRAYDIYTSTVRYRYALMCMSDGNADEAIYLYQLVKLFLLKRRDLLLDPSASDIDRSGKELMPDQSYLPASVYIRSVQLSFQAEEAVLAEREGPRIVSIGPIRIIGPTVAGGRRAIQLSGAV